MPVPFLSRRASTWVLFGLCLTALLAVMVWVSTTTLDLEKKQNEARHAALVEEQVRLALWRLDSALAPILAMETARPHRAYREGHIDPTWPVLMHFRVHPDGRVTTPTEGHEDQFEALKGTLGRDRVLAAIPSGPLVAGEPLEEDEWVTVTKTVAVASTKDGKKKNKKKDEEVLLAANNPPAQETYAQKKKSQAEFNKRALSYQRTLDNVANSAQQQWEPPANSLGSSSARRSSSSSSGGGFLGLFQGERQQATETPPDDTGKDTGNAADLPQEQSANTDLARRGTPPKTRQKKISVKRIRTLEVNEGMMHPVWVGGRLLLARRAEVDGAIHVEGVWLDWEGLEKDLLRDITDLLPKARLLPVLGGASAERLLVTLPVRLEPGNVPMPEIEGLGALSLSLIVAWICVLVAVGAVLVLLKGAVGLSERRGAFVSAVTHELRTPLTTFRMYTEMLDEGMVDEQKRSRYVSTLRREADRLGALVENVLAYARIERKAAGGKGQVRIETMTVATLLEKVRPRMEERCGQANLELEVRLPDAVSGLSCKVDPGTTEQILFNLVDNAAKYAASAEDRRLEVDVSASAKQVLLMVRDHGPGIPVEEHKRIFEPFSKAKRDASGTAPGVGLGLALSRELAKAMGGRLTIVPSQDGAAFQLAVPRV